MVGIASMLYAAIIVGTKPIAEVVGVSNSTVQPIGRFTVLTVDTNVAFS